jgi:hypothetical protein
VVEVTPIREVISRGESETTEFKQSLADSRAIADTLSAFANARGGTILVGVRDDGVVLGVSLGKNSIPNLVNSLQQDLDPRQMPQMDEVEVDGCKILVLTMQSSPNTPISSSGKAYLRVGPTNQRLSSEEQRRRYRSEVEGRDDLPTFDVQGAGGARLESGFSPSFRVSQASGTNVPDVQWTIRGPRFPIEWRYASGATLERTNFSGTFDLSLKTGTDDRVGLNELGFEMRFPWHGVWQHELHRWAIERRELPNKVLWEVKDPILPVTRWEGESL